MERRIIEGGWEQDERREGKSRGKNESRRAGGLSPALANNLAAPQYRNMNDH